MLPLADLQRRVRDAVVTGEDGALEPLLAGGPRGRARLAIHRRHYHASLAMALVERFPAASWLAGSPLVTDAARAFVAAHPPSRPCVAEYGETFPAFLASRPGAAGLPYLEAFAGLEWHLGRVSLAVTGPPLAWSDLQAVDPERLTDLRLALQPDLAYVHVPWNVDELMRAYLADAAPERFVLDARDVWLELRGARGALQLTRLARPVFAFRDSLHRGSPLADAVLAALEVDRAFDASGALAALMGDGLVMSPLNQEERAWQ